MDMGELDVVKGMPNPTAYVKMSQKSACAHLRLGAQFLSFERRKHWNFSVAHALP
ncbi:MAG: hypothetical protein L6V93_10325 [Clostridiales bacterium]|nr:MAG: hypothetical protein L6V93_10325 [Clostridiales bacterium]